jgi:hypothetical protein
MEWRIEMKSKLDLAVSKIMAGSACGSLRAAALKGDANYFRTILAPFFKADKPAKQPAATQDAEETGNPNSPPSSVDQVDPVVPTLAGEETGVIPPADPGAVPHPVGDHVEGNAAPNQARGEGMPENVPL